MKKKIYIALIVPAITVFGSCIVAANNRITNVVQSTEHTLKSTEVIQGLKVSRTEGSIIAPDNIDDMISKSDLIVIGKPTQSILESTPLIQRDSEGYVSEAISLTQFKIQRVLKGQPYADTIAIGQQAAVLTDKRTAKTFLQVFDDYQPLVKNAKYILFLRKGLNNSPLYFPYGVYYGKVNVDGSDQAEDNIQSLDFQSIRKAVLQRFQQVANQT